MSRQQALQPAPTQGEQASGALKGCYTAAQIIALLQISQRSFFALKRVGRLPFLEELRPRLGRSVRYRADLVDRYLAGQWGQSRAFGSHGRKCAGLHTGSIR